MRVRLRPRKRKRVASISANHPLSKGERWDLNPRPPRPQLTQAAQLTELRNDFNTRSVAFL